jgi:hypothetical protein
MATQMEKTPSLFIPIASTEEILDAKSWINTSYEWHQEWQDLICRRLGEALASWTSVEWGLLQLYLEAIKPKDGRAAVGAWDSLQSPRALIDMTNAAVCVMDNKKADLEVWGKINVDLIKKLSRRNQIAHCQIYYDHNAKAPERKMFLGSHKQTKGIDERIYSSELVDMRQVFVALSEKIAAFRASLA